MEVVSEGVPDNQLVSRPRLTFVFISNKTKLVRLFLQDGHYLMSWFWPSPVGRCQFRTTETARLSLIISLHKLQKYKKLFIFDAFLSF